MGKKSVYFIRHGECVGNTVPMFGTDSPLTEKGIGQSINLCECLDVIKKDLGLIIVSDTKRAVETVRRVFPERNTFIMDRRFREIHFGKLEGAKVTYEHLSKIQKHPELIKNFYYGDDFSVRVDEAVSAVGNFLSLSFGDLAIVGHDTLFEFILEKIGYYRFYGIPFELWSDACRFSNCSYVRVDSDMFV